MLKNCQESKFCVRHILPHKIYHVAAAVLSYKSMLDISSLHSSKCPLAQDGGRPRVYRFVARERPESIGGSQHQIQYQTSLVPENHLLLPDTD